MTDSSLDPPAAPAAPSNATAKTADASPGRLAFDARRLLVDLSRGPKRLVLVSSDLVLLSLALWLSLSLRLSTPYWPKSAFLATILASLLVVLL